MLSTGMNTSFYANAGDVGLESAVISRYDVSTTF